MKTRIVMAATMALSFTTWRLSGGESVTEAGSHRS
jgi:hypothetical protein